MPRKRKLIAHLARMNAKRTRPAPDSTVIEELSAEDDGGPERPDQPGSGNTESDSELPYWPSEEDAYSTVLPDDEINSLKLKWVPSARPKCRMPHIGVSRWRKQRRNAENEKRKKVMSGSKTFFDMWNIDRSNSQETITPQAGSELTIYEGPESRVLQILEDSFHVDAPNRSFEYALKTTSHTDFLRLICIYRYLQMLEKKLPQVKSSEDIAQSIYPNMKKERRGRNIRIWASFFLKNHKLPSNHQGCHIKTESIIADENTQNFCRQWLRSQRSNAISGKSFAE